jgi:hypothetical protein
MSIRVREERYMSLSLSVIFAALDGSFALLDRGHHPCHRQYRQSRIVLLFNHELEYLILAV